MSPGLTRVETKFEMDAEPGGDHIIHADGRCYVQDNREHFPRTFPFKYTKERAALSRCPEEVPCFHSLAMEDMPKMGNQVSLHCTGRGVCGSHDQPAGFFPENALHHQRLVETDEAPPGGEAAG